MTAENDWPDDLAGPKNLPKDAELAKILYQAIVDEVADQRAAAAPIAAAPSGLPAYPRFSKQYADLAKAAYDEALKVEADKRAISTSPPDAPAGWPSYPAHSDRYSDMAQAVYEAELKSHTAADEQRRALAHLRSETDIALMRGYHEVVREVAKEAVTGADRLPQLVIGSAAAIVTLYSGLLGLVFAAGSRALPPWALIAALFLGAAIALATGYAAYLTKRKDTEFETADGVWANASAFTNGFLDWVDAAIRERARTGSSRSCPAATSADRSS